MRFEDQEESSHVEDRRGDGPVYGGRGPSYGMRLPMGRGGLGIGGVLLLLLIGWLAGVDPLQLLNGNVVPTRAPAGSQRTTAEEEKLVVFVRKVLRTTETCWTDVFRSSFAREYELPTLVLFRNGVDSACGMQSSAVGPFYCPGDRKLYIDLSFLDEMHRTLGAGGDFAQAYVVAHEVGHHVQNLLGTSRKVDAVRGGEAERNRASVRLELQADYYAGVWAHYVDTKMRTAKLDVGDYEEAIRAAQAVGDDVLQRRANGRVVPEKFTHGSAAQRAKWFKLGFETGDPKAHDPFVEEK